MFVNRFHSGMQRYPHSTSLHDVKTFVSTEENSRKEKATKKVSLFVTLLKAGD